MGFIIGLKPAEVWELDLWEFNSCVRAYAERQKQLAEQAHQQAWQTAAYTGAAFAGKLKDYKHYTKKAKKAQAPKISEEEFERKLELAKRAQKK